MNGQEVPVACDPTAIAATDRPRYSQLIKQLRSAVRDRHELSDGFVYELDSKAIALTEVAEWITLERLCCPFLTFNLQVAGGGDPRLTLRGPDGVKAILQEEFPRK
ncbi:MAG TPA: hypothetical protein VKR43_06770 [Bryobacteraceae bacterium]|nr:hypothetical protein [Bryobacteraceae bacterium]